MCATRMGLKFAVMEWFRWLLHTRTADSKRLYKFHVLEYVYKSGLGFGACRIGSFGKRGGTRLAVKSLSKCMCDSSWGLGVGE